jgi:hypothetical protein
VRKCREAHVVADAVVPPLVRGIEPPDQHDAVDVRRQRGGEEHERLVGLEAPVRSAIGEIRIDPEPHQPTSTSS